MEIVSHPRQTQNKRPVDLLCRCLAPKGDRLKMHGRCCSRPELPQQLVSRWTGAPARGALVAGAEPTPETISSSFSLRQACPSPDPSTAPACMGWEKSGQDDVSFPGPGWLPLPSAASFFLATIPRSLQEASRVSQFLDGVSSSERP